MWKLLAGLNPIPYLVGLLAAGSLAIGIFYAGVYHNESEHKIIEAKRQADSEALTERARESRRGLAAVASDSAKEAVAADAKLRARLAALTNESANRKASGVQVVPCPAHCAISSELRDAISRGANNTEYATGTRPGVSETVPNGNATNADNASGRGGTVGLSTRGISIVPKLESAGRGDLQPSAGSSDEIERRVKAGNEAAEKRIAEALGRVPK